MRKDLPPLGEWSGDNLKFRPVIVASLIECKPKMNYIVINLLSFYSHKTMAIHDGGKCMVVDDTAAVATATIRRPLCSHTGEGTRSSIQMYEIRYSDTSKRIGISTNFRNNLISTRDDCRDRYSNFSIIRFGSFWPISRPLEMYLRCQTS